MPWPDCRLDSVAGGRSGPVMFVRRHRTSAAGFSVAELSAANRIIRKDMTTANRYQETVQWLYTAVGAAAVRGQVHLPEMLLLAYVALHTELPDIAVLCGDKVGKARPAYPGRPTGS